MADPVTTVKSLLENTWDSSNTDNKTPKFISVIDVKVIDKSHKEDWIIVHRPSENPVHAGVGGVARHKYDKVNIDVRSFGDETHFNKLMTEVERILDVKQKNPDGGTYYNYLESMFQKQDLSDRFRLFYRKVWPVELQKYAEVRTTP